MATAKTSYGENLESILAALIQGITEIVSARVKEDFRQEFSGIFGGNAAPAPRTPAPKAAKKTAAPKTEPEKKEILPPHRRHEAPYTLTPGGDPEVLKSEPGRRRGDAQIAEAGTVLLGWFKKNPGSRIDQAAAAFKVPVKDLQLPIQYMLKKKMLTKKGKLRGTAYTASGGKAPAKSKSSKS